MNTAIVKFILGLPLVYIVSDGNVHTSPLQTRHSLCSCSAQKQCCALVLFSSPIVREKLKHEERS